MRSSFFVSLLFVCARLKVDAWQTAREKLQQPKYHSSQEKQQPQDIYPVSTNLFMHLSPLNRFRKDNVINMEADKLFTDGDRRSFLLSMIVSSLVSPSLATATENDTDELQTIETIISIVDDENDLNREIIQEEKDEAKAMEDTMNLISELEGQIKDASANIDADGSESFADSELTLKEKKIISDTEALIKEQENIKSETEDVIAKIESMEEKVKDLNQDPTLTDFTESEAFVNQLKKNVEEKVDLIAKLKRQSERDIDPNTGKFRPMTQKEFKEIAKSKDYNYLQILEDSLVNNRELEKDLKAFEGLLEKTFGSVVKEWREDVAPVVNDSVDEFEKIKQNTGNIIEKIQKIF